MVKLKDWKSTVAMVIVGADGGPACDDTKGARTCHR
jgi:hypothetical protein